MPKYEVVFTEESTTNHTYYVDANNNEEAYLLAEDKYFNFGNADSTQVVHSQTLVHKVKNLNEENANA
jgi:1,2-phenylacetyl-CoA epoxidase PaaB subunit